MAAFLVMVLVYLASGIILLVSLTLLYLCVEYRLKGPDEIPTLHFSESPLHRHILKRCPQVTRPFRTTFLTGNAHVQTVLGTFLPRANVGFINRELVTLDDGGLAAIDWAQKDDLGGSSREDMPVLVVIPGLTGDAGSLSHVCKLALSRGFRPVVFNKRGHGGSLITTPKLLSFGDPTDLHQVVSHVKRKYPKAKLTAVGYSAGSGLLVSYLGEYGSSCLLNTAVCISPGYDAEYFFEHCIRHPYDYLLLRSLKNLLRNHEEILSTVVDVKHAMSSTKLVDLEERLYCRLYGYKTMSEYWRRNNPMRDIDKVRVPVLCISGQDDPICRKDCIQFSMFEDLPKFMLVAPTRGGHCGFLEGPTLQRWADVLCVDYLTAILDYMNIQAR